MTRSFDQRSHSYLGYALRVTEEIGSQEEGFFIGIGKAAQTKHKFRVGDIISGQSLPVLDNRLEAVEFYKTSNLRVIERAKKEQHEPLPVQTERLPGCVLVHDLAKNVVYRMRDHPRI